MTIYFTFILILNLTGLIIMRREFVLLYQGGLGEPLKWVLIILDVLAGGCLVWEFLK